MPYVKMADGIEELHILNPGAELFQLVRNLAIDRHRRAAFELHRLA